MILPVPIKTRLSGKNPLLLFILWFLITGLVLLPEISFADHLHDYENQTEPDDSRFAPELTWYGVDKVNRTHSYLSSSIENFSQRIDLFFGENRVYEEATGTYVQVRSSAVLDQKGNVDYDLKFRAKLRLPQLKSRFRLVFETDDEQGLVDDFDQDSKDRSLINELESKDISASLQYILKQTNYLNVSLRPGVKLSDPLEAFIRARVSRTVQLTDRWLSRGTGEFGYFTEEGWGNDWKLEIERRTGSQNFFRTASNARWREDNPGNWFLSQTLLFTHILNPRSSLAYSIGLTGETRPSLHNETYFANVRYRRDIHRGWLFMELKPQVTFAKENNYDEDVSLLLTLEVLLGETYSHD